MSPTASVVVPCFNVADTLESQLERLVPQVRAAGAELILVDNNSTDDTAHLIDLAALDEHVVATSAPTQQGASHARNVGVRHARADRLLFCDADDIVGDRWVEKLITALESHDVVTGSLDTSALNGTELAKSRRSTRRMRGAQDTFYGLFPTVHGGNMAVRRSAWDHIGELDETLEAIEDMEWALRAQLSGHHIVHVPDASVGYRYRTDPHELWNQGLRYGRNRPRVARMAHEALGQRPARLAGLRSWFWLVRNVGLVRHTSGRAQLAWVAGNRVGNLLGSVDARFMVL